VWSIGIVICSTIAVGRASCWTGACQFDIQRYVVCIKIIASRTGGVGGGHHHHHHKRLLHQEPAGHHHHHHHKRLLHQEPVVLAQAIPTSTTTTSDYCIKNRRGHHHQQHHHKRLHQEPVVLTTSDWIKNRWCWWMPSPPTPQQAIGSPTGGVPSPLAPRLDELQLVKVVEYCINDFAVRLLRVCIDNIVHVHYTVATTTPHLMISGAGIRR
jgi:hypothetical protein